MTIGIAAFGENAGQAVLAALHAVESVGSGAIGGFVSVAALHGDQAIRATIQRGGTRALKLGRSSSAFKRASLAALISSGPDRPEPLEAFIAARAGIGLVTGHRMPNTPGHDGRALNLLVLDGMVAGRQPREAIQLVLADNQLADAGLIAMNTAGDAFADNTPSVKARPDSGYAFEARGSARVVILHNAITPSGVLAALAAEIALDVLEPTSRICNQVMLHAGCPIRSADKPALVATADGKVSEIRCVGPVTEDEMTIDVGYRPDVIVNDRLYGVLLYEPFLLARNAQLVSADGRSAFTLPVGCLS